MTDSSPANMNRGNQKEADNFLPEISSLQPKIKTLVPLYLNKAVHEMVWSDLNCKVSRTVT